MRPQQRVERSLSLASSPLVTALQLFKTGGALAIGYSLTLQRTVKLPQVERLRVVVHVPVPMQRQPPTIQTVQDGCFGKSLRKGTQGPFAKRGLAWPRRLSRYCRTVLDRFVESQEFPKTAKFNSSRTFYKIVDLSVVVQHQGRTIQSLTRMVTTVLSSELRPRRPSCTESGCRS